MVFTMILLVSSTRMQVKGQTILLPSDSAYNFIVLSDYGRNGFYNQKEVADMMARIATDCSVRFYVTGGDNFQISGVQSVQDPLWMASFENIYTHPSSHYDWYPALGNHDHGGNVQAQIDYSRISRRWCMLANYYTVIKSRNGVNIRLMIIDTYPVVSAFSGTNPDYSVLDAQKQLIWVDSVLTVANEDWTIIVGHHPIYSAHPSRGNTEALVDHLNPILNEHNVDFYIGSHDHIFQHLKIPGSKIDYFVNTAASETRPESYNKMTVFSVSSPGFILCSATKTNLSIYFINIDGKAMYHYVREK